MVMIPGPSPLDTISTGDKCLCDFPYCSCQPTEKALHFVMAGGASLNPEQREWCLGEIACVEGFRREDYADLPDAEVARGVMDAWIDYCQDKGIL